MGPDIKTRIRARFARRNSGVPSLASSSHSDSSQLHADSPTTPKPLADQLPPPAAARTCSVPPPPASSANADSAPQLDGVAPSSGTANHHHDGCGMAPDGVGAAGEIASLPSLPSIREHSPPSSSSPPGPPHHPDSASFPDYDSDQLDPLTRVGSNANPIAAPFVGKGAPTTAMTAPMIAATTPAASTTARSTGTTVPATTTTSPVTAVATPAAGLLAPPTAAMVPPTTTTGASTSATAPVTTNGSATATPFGTFVPMGEGGPAAIGTTANSSSGRPIVPARRQSLFPSRQTALINSLLQASQASSEDPSNIDNLPLITRNMMTRRIWVRRGDSPSAPTLVTVYEDDLVDDARVAILRKYANSLGRQFDAPDLILHLAPRERRRARALRPDEPLARVLDASFPGGQTLEEAIIIEIQMNRVLVAPGPATPPVGQVPHPSLYPGRFEHLERQDHHGQGHQGHGQHGQSPSDGRPSETGEGYFPPVSAIPSPHASVSGPTGGGPGGAPIHSISVLGTGHIAAIPSPGGNRSRAYRERPERPRLGRTHTSSPTVLGGAQAASLSGGSVQHDHHSPPAPPAMPTPPAVDTVPSQRVATPPPRVSSPRPSVARTKKSRRSLDNSIAPAPPNPALATPVKVGVPPINVLIVEDNPINLKLLEAFVKRLKVRWQTATNGRDAVNKWREGGFHLVLMDIQLPIMNGLDATREIRRLERINNIGKLTSANRQAHEEGDDLPDGEDRLKNRERFKSIVIIVALTASSLQSDRRDALAAGCNDFLTKPVNFAWLENKVMEWGCMQALIDFDGFREWKKEREANRRVQGGQFPKGGLSKSRTSTTLGAEGGESSTHGAARERALAERPAVLERLEEVDSSKTDSPSSSTPTTSKSASGDGRASSSKAKSLETASSSNKGKGKKVRSSSSTSSQQG